MTRDTTGTSAMIDGIARPLDTALLVDPRINLADVDYELIPADVDVFRYGAFTQESMSAFGTHVAGWFIDDSLGTTELTNVRLRGEYQIDSVLFDGSRSTVSASEIQGLGYRNVYDYTRLISEVPDVAHHFMRVFRPPAISRMVAAVAAMGYSTLLILDRDLSSITTGRPYISERRAPMSADYQLSTTRRQDSWDLTNSGIALLKSTMNAFPETEFRDATVGNRMRLVLDPADAQPLGGRLVPRPKYPSVMDHFYAELPVGPEGEDLRCGYVTMCDSEDYLWGVRALANSLAQVSNVPLILMVPPGFDISGVTFAHGNVRLYEVNSIRNPHQPRKHQLRFANTYTKLEVFGLNFLDRAAFIDADTVVLRNPDEIFAYSSFAAAPDFGLRLENSTFNSGVFVCTPSSELYTRMIDAIPHTPSSDGGDQGFLNEFMVDVEWLPPEFNALRRALARFPDVVGLEDARIVHYVGPKPWSLRGEPEWSALDSLWFAQLSEGEKTAFIVDLRDRVAKHVMKLDSRASKNSESVRMPEFKRAEKLLAEGKPNSAIKVAKAALRNNPDSMANRRVLARALSASGNTSASVKVVAKTTAMRATNLVRRVIAK